MESTTIRVKTRAAAATGLTTEERAVVALVSARLRRKAA
jgi:hypothetical protein